MWLSKLIPITEESSQVKKNHLTGRVERHHMKEATFNEQFYNFNTYGVFMDTAGGGSKFFEKKFYGDDPTQFELQEVSFTHAENSRRCHRQPTVCVRWVV